MKKSKLPLFVLSTCLLVISACGGNSTNNSSNNEVSSLDNTSSVLSSESSSIESSSLTPSSSESSTVESSSPLPSSSSVAQSYNVSAKESAYVTVSISGGAEHKEETEVTFTITLKNENVRLDSVKALYSKNGEKKELQLKNAGDTYSFTMPSANVEIQIEAHEEEVKYSISLPEGNDVSVTIEGGYSSCVAGTNVIFKVVSNNEDKEIDVVTVKDASGNPIGLNNGGDGRYAFQMPEANVTIAVTLKNKKYTYSLVNAEHVSFAVIGKEESWNEGEEVTISFSANYGYSLKSVSCKGAKTNKDITLTKGSTTYTFTMPKENVVFTFEVNEMHTITVQADTHLTVNLSSDKEYYDINEEVSFTIDVPSKFLIDTLTIKTATGSTVSYTENEGTYKFNMPDSNVTIKVTEKLDENVSSNPFKEGDRFEGSWIYYNSGDNCDYLMRMCVLFAGDNTLSYAISYELDYDYGSEYDDYYTVETQTAGPIRRNSAFPSTISGMQGTCKQGCSGADYTFDSTTNRVTASVKFNMNNNYQLVMEATFNGDNVTKLKVIDNMDDGYCKTKNVILTKK